MKENERKQIKALSEEQLSTIDGEIANLKEVTQPVLLDGSVGRVSRMEAINNKAINDKQLRDKHVQMQKPERALQRVDKQEVGKCSRCGHEIAMGRLKHMPYTTKCVNCAWKDRLPMPDTYRPCLK